MKKSEKMENTANTGAPVPPEATAITAEAETPVKEKPRRGRKPKAAKKPEESVETSAQENDSAKETAEECQASTGEENAMPESASETEVSGQESEPVPKQMEESAASIATDTAMESTTETGKEAVTEPEPVPETAIGEQEETPPGTTPEGDTEAQNATAEEPATTQENAVKTATEGIADAGESGEEPEPEQDGDKEKDTAPVPFPAASAQIVESPLKSMKREFHERSQIIKEEMRNIQNSFIKIGFQLHWIKENNMYRVMNYKSIYEYAEKEYGIKRTTCCNFICIIENYAERDQNGDVIESIADCYRNYSASQLVAMLGMPEELKQQVSPDMSVRAINRLRKEEAEASKTVEAAPATEEEPNEAPAPVPVKEAAVMPEPDTSAAPDDAVHVETEVPADEEAPGDMVETEEEPEAAEEQETDIFTEESERTPADDTVSEETPATEETSEEVPESIEGTELETDGDAAGQLENKPHVDGDTLAEIDSYNDYQSMADELDLIMRHVFSGDSSVRVKIVCVQG